MPLIIIIIISTSFSSSNLSSTPQHTIIYCTEYYYYYSIDRVSLDNRGERESTGKTLTGGNHSKSMRERETETKGEKTEIDLSKYSQLSSGKAHNLES